MIGCGDQKIIKKVIESTVRENITLIWNIVKYVKVILPKYLLFEIRSIHLVLIISFSPSPINTIKFLLIIFLSAN